MRKPLSSTAQQLIGVGVITTVCLIGAQVISNKNSEAHDEKVLSATEQTNKQNQTTSKPSPEQQKHSELTSYKEQFGDWTTEFDYINTTSIYPEYRGYNFHAYSETKPENWRKPILDANYQEMDELGYRVVVAAIEGDYSASIEIVSDEIYVGNCAPSHQGFKYYVNVNGRRITFEFFCESIGNIVHLFPAHGYNELFTNMVLRSNNLVINGVTYSMKGSTKAAKAANAHEHPLIKGVDYPES